MTFGPRVREEAKAGRPWSNCRRARWAPGRRPANGSGCRLCRLDVVVCGDAVLIVRRNAGRRRAHRCHQDLLEMTMPRASRARATMCSSENITSATRAEPGSSSP